MHRRLLTIFILTATLCLFASSALAQTPSGDGDDRVTGHPYLRHDGGTDQAIQEYSSAATSPAPDNIADDGDIDSNDGGNRHQNNEPFSVIDPTNPTSQSMHIRGHVGGGGRCSRSLAITFDRGCEQGGPGGDFTGASH
jgi:hypothetical protein